jgi:hypothetical protein
LALLDDCKIPIWDAASGDLLMLVCKNNAMLNTFAADNGQNRPAVIRNLDGCKNFFDVVILSLSEDR